ncbi:hypothetical protein PR003_g21229 [Phytophthora rubi]|uniref:Uncharacterized protein n=1 Tax=Phytophthora rubi TaxID=129364 RepID=A0A6A4DFX9_9STRA|nr:hypothetical protein PR002_g18869 [Phytophthora rubi]KAE9306493.1 hypothetical protein PR003_g21229 [Phytophthora rubi]
MDGRGQRRETAAEVGGMAPPPPTAGKRQQRRQVGQRGSGTYRARASPPPAASRDGGAPTPAERDGRRATAIEASISDSMSAAWLLLVLYNGANAVGSSEGRQKTNSTGMKRR